MHEVVLEILDLFLVPSQSVSGDVSGGGGDVSLCPLSLATEKSLASFQDGQQNHDQCMAIIKADILKHGYHLEGTTPSDGNCFFWSVSQHLDQKCVDETVTHTQLRAKVVDHLRQLSMVILFSL